MRKELKANSDTIEIVVKNKPALIREENVKKAVIELLHYGFQLLPVWVLLIVQIMTYVHITKIDIAENLLVISIVSNATSVHRDSTGNISQGIKEYIVVFVKILTIVLATVSLSIIYFSKLGEGYITASGETSAAILSGLFMVSTICVSFIGKGEDR